MVWAIVQRCAKSRPATWKASLVLAAVSTCLFIAAGFTRGSLELDVRSDYSHIRIYRNGNLRTLVFVRDSGEEAYESQVDVEKPYELRFAYLKDMFASYFLQSKPKHVLIVGLGGGSMVHFLRHYDPDVQIDVLEIDPTVVDIAKRYFNVRASDKVKIITADGLKYLETTKSRYDIIYMDAFLKPSAQTDGTGAPLNLRTLEFYANVQKRLNANGLVVFNLNPHAGLNEDVRTIQKAFPQVYSFHLPRFQGKVAVASMVPERVERSTLRERAQALDRRFNADFSFQTILGHLEK
jgi:spermidine synthase